VLLEPSPVGAAQVVRFQRIIGEGLTLASNARPLQPLNGRTISFGHGVYAGGAGVMG
jgi:carbonic anhydrase